MKKINKVSNNPKNIATAVLMLISTAVFVYAFYIFQSQYLYKLTAVIAWVVILSGLFFITDKGRDTIQFFKDSKIELQKVVWPARQETIQTTTIVMVMVAITGIVLWGIDLGMMWTIGKITHLG